MKSRPLPAKICVCCQREFSWRKKWQLNWDQVKYCSKRCQGQGAVAPFDGERVHRMAWEDRTPFEAIQAQFGLNEKQVIGWMKSTLSPSRFEAWRKRVQKQGALKRVSERGFATGVFKASCQRLDGTVKRSK